MGNLNSVPLDFVARLKVGGTHLTYGYLKQFPVLPPSAYAQSDLAFIVPRVLELTYTSHSMALFARDLGYDGPPFPWDEERRARLRAELDAIYARKYGLTRDELRYILDPADVKGPDYPSETFRVLKSNDIRRFGPEDSRVSVAAGQAAPGMGTYRTARLVLEAWDRMERDELGEISPPITVAPAASVPVFEPADFSTLPDGAWATPAGGDLRAKTLAQIAAVLKALSGPTPIHLARRAALYALEPRLLTPRLDDAQRAEWRRLVGAEAEPREGVTTLGLGGATGWGDAVRLLAATGALIEDGVSPTWAPGQGLDAYFTESWPQRAVFALPAAASILASESAEDLSTEEEAGLTALAA